LSTGIRFLTEEGEVRATHMAALAPIECPIKVGFLRECVERKRERSAARRG
jgi:hypothetical protein